jgi:primase-polymerase (primpol)-like protein
MLSNALMGLSYYPQFLICKLVYTPGVPKPDKLPINPATLTKCNPHDPNLWVSCKEAKQVLATLDNSIFCLAFVFTKADPFFFLDIDNCLVNGQWSELANSLMGLLDGAAIETSVSGQGLHIFGMCTKPIEHSCKNKEYGIEFYTSGRFVALTDLNTVGNAAIEYSAVLQSIIDTYFPPKQVNVVEWSKVPVPEWSGPEDNDEGNKELIDRALRSQSAASAFGNKASFADLWNNNEQVLANCYSPLNQVDPYDRSSADMALAKHLAFWTGKNHDRMWRLMWNSVLRRDKWEKHKTYLSTTICNAVNQQKDVLKSSTPTPSENNSAINSTTFLSANDQLKYFKNCIYVRKQHRVFVPDGDLLKPDQFRASYGGRTFVMEPNGKRTTRNAFEAFTENQVVQQKEAHGTCFRPELETGIIINEESRKLVNVYVPIITKRSAGDPSPFLKHLDVIIPTDREREIMLTYMAACVQYKGHKFQWCPLLQGVEGNGKTLLGNVVAHAVGHRYTHLPNASDLGANGFKFNSWIANMLLIIIEEIYTSNRREITEPLKVMVSNARLEIQPKGMDQYTGDNRANFILFTNHKDAILVTIDSRRYCVIFSAQQTRVDIERDGMGGNYFPALYNWLRNSYGYEIVNEFLHNYSIPAELNPAGSCQRAPSTSSTDEAIELSRGGVEADILEAIDEGRPGFKLPWVSSKALEKLLIEMGANRRIPANKRKSLMEGLGYIWHPRLTKGRLNKPIVIEGGRPILYIKRNDPLMHMDIPNDIYDQYMLSQGYIVTDPVNVVSMNK